MKYPTFIPLCIVILLASIVAGRSQETSATAAAAAIHYEKLVPSGEVVNEGGIYDPSLKYDSDGKTGWMAYSVILKGGHKWLPPIGPYCETHLARTTDGGRTWEKVKALNSSRDDTLTHYDKSKLKGVWRYEVPTFVHDPDDTGREWKLFAHRYFWTPEHDRMPAYGWIAYSYAANPAGEWSQEVALFGAGQFPPPPYHQTSIDLNALDPSLRKAVAYTEPGSLFHDGVLYLSLTALERTGPASIFLLASDDHGAAWQFLGTLLTDRDAAAFGYRRFDGSSLVLEAGRAFLFVSPESSQTEHDGTMIFEFADLRKGLLKRTASGSLILHKHLHPQTDIKLTLGGAGQSDYDEHNTYGGIVMPQMNMATAPEVFQLFSTRRRVAEEGK